MLVIFGGAYNGKLRYVKQELGYTEQQIFFCANTELDFSKVVICGLHQFIYERAIKGMDSLSYIQAHHAKLVDKIIICDDVSSGIVPLKKEERFFREETGRVLQYLNTHSTMVIRLFYGIPSVLKDE